MSLSGSEAQVSTEITGEARCVILPAFRVPLFGRKKELEEIHNILEYNRQSYIPKIVTLEGVGGMGKTSIAREYAAHYGNYDIIVWIPSETGIAMDRALYQSLLQLKPEDAVAEDHVKNRVLFVRYLSSCSKFIARVIFWLLPL